KLPDSRVLVIEGEIKLNPHGHKGAERFRLDEYQIVVKVLHGQHTEILKPHPTECKLLKPRSTSEYAPSSQITTSAGFTTYLGVPIIANRNRATTTRRVQSGHVVLKIQVTRFKLRLNSLTKKPGPQESHWSRSWLSHIPNGLTNLYQLELISRPTMTPAPMNMNWIRFWPAKDTVVSDAKALGNLIRHPSKIPQYFVAPRIFTLLTAAVCVTYSGWGIVNK
ncbi:hypothetical protein BS47DRAFT_1353575, partial [Hydnum rufescens UP504]